MVAEGVELETNILHAVSRKSANCCELPQAPLRHFFP